MTRFYRREIHHVAFDVPNVSDAIKFFHLAFGLGPFYRLLNPLGNDPGYVGPGFGYWGGIYVELMDGPGDVWPQFHDTSHDIGCAIEVHGACADLDTFFRMVTEASVDWDGNDLERVTPAPGTW